MKPTTLEIRIAVISTPLDDIKDSDLSTTRGFMGIKKEVSEIARKILNDNLPKGYRHSYVVACRHLKKKGA
jgi:hypothetical protein